jgi:hypothetical protein
MGASARDSGKSKSVPSVQQFHWRESGQAGVECTWNDIPTVTIGTVIQSVTNAGAAIILGRTSDHGAYSICVLDGTQKIKEYPHGSEACCALLQSLIEHYNS